MFSEKDEDVAEPSVDRAPQINMADVARHAGVSTATVSRALRGLPGVSEPTRQRIKELADELAYVVSPEASRLSGGGTGRVALVVPSINRWFYASILAGIEAVLRRADIDVLIYHVETAADRSRFFERLPARRKVDAVVLIALPVTEAELRRLELMGVSVVVAGGTTKDYPNVCIDDAEVAGKAVDHLIRLGHRSIAMIRTTDLDGTIWAPERARTRGFQSSLARAGLDCREEWLVTVPWGIDGGARAMDQLLSLEQMPTAVFAYSDEVAMGALRSLRRAGIDVPGQMSIIGVDDHPLAELSDLTTVHQSVEMQGTFAGGIVLDQMQGRVPAEPHVVVPTQLVVRGSTGPPPP
ncbi:MAG: LacI family DNA-binding transcriptional regulator [Nocardioidaceae bacterium]